MRVTFGSYGKTPRTKTIRGAAPCRSWFAHSPAKPFAGRRAAGVVSVCGGVGPGVGREPVRAHGVEDPRWVYEGHNHLHSADRRRLSVAGYGIRAPAIRWRSSRAMEAASG